MLSRHLYIKCSLSNQRPDRLFRSCRPRVRFNQKTHPIDIQIQITAISGRHVYTLQQHQLRLSFSENRNFINKTIQAQKGTPLPSFSENGNFINERIQAQKGTTQQQLAFHCILAVRNLVLSPTSEKCSWWDPKHMFCLWETLMLKYSVSFKLKANHTFWDRSIALSKIPSPPVLQSD